MKKSVKIMIIGIGLTILLIGLDLSSILIINKPIFALKEDCDCADKVYYGLLYNTYNCHKQDKAQIKLKWTKFKCEKIVIIGKIIDIKDTYLVIKGVSDNNYLKTNDEAHISLINNPKISGANNLIIGQYVKVNSSHINEIYPSLVTTDEIKIISATQS